MKMIPLKKLTYFVGIDISKKKLDIAVMTEKDLLFHRIIDNLPEDISCLLNQLKALPGYKLSKTIFCMEQTGIYSKHLQFCLKKCKANFVVEHPLQIRNSLGVIRNKSDKIDAIRIAQYACKNSKSLRFWTPQRPIIEHLKQLSTLRNRLVTLKNAINVPLKEHHGFTDQLVQDSAGELTQRTLEAIKMDLKNVEANINTIVNSDIAVQNLMNIITSVKCVGPVTALEIILCTNEFKNINSPKKFACYAGVAPFKKESGIFQGTPKVSKIANKKMKALLNICAVIAIKYERDLKLYYERKTQIERKHKMLVINAIRYKLILRIFACVAQNRLYQAEYEQENTFNSKISD